MNTTSRRDFLCSVGQAALGLAGATGYMGCAVAPTSHPEASKLNFVFILIDDLGWMDTSCYGSAFYETPNIDRLASEGMRFTDAYATAPVCSPTRASIMTGRYPAKLGITYALPGPAPRRTKKLLEPRLRDGLALDEVSIAEKLRTAGYISASVGKWHLGGEEFYPELQGFDSNIGGTHIGMVNDFFYPAWKESRHGPTDARGGLPLDGQPGEYLPERLADEATKFIEQNRERQFFLYLSHYIVHSPIQAKPDVVSKYESKLKPGQAQDNPTYAAMVEAMDESVGTVLRKLEELQIADRTVVIFTSDNGGLHKPDGPAAPVPATSNTPLREGKKYAYEGGIRVPLIVRWPGTVQANSICNTPVTSVDFYPTMLEIAGVQEPSDHTVDGVSLVPLLKSTSELPARELYWHFPHYSGGQTPAGAIRQGDFKLLEFFEDGHLELYNLRDDIGETENLVDRMPEKAKSLQGLLAAWRKSAGAEMPTRNPNYESPERIEAGKRNGK